MSPTPKSRRLLAAAGLALGSLVLVSGSALAGSCPVDKVGVDVTKPGAMKPKDVTDDVLAATDLSKEKIALAGRQLRLRKLVVQPGGIVPWHSHADRPAIIYITEGEIVEYASNCAAPIVHKAGDVVAETPDVSHWWKNLGDKTVVLLSADLLKDTSDHNM